jgi:DNA-binding winged helix-turn-helix (wHTH) protein/tetratricopeptide (TPR) repeat protein
MSAARPVLAFGAFTLQPRLQRLVRDGRIVPLKPKAYDLLCRLLDHRDRVVSRAELMDWLWPRQDVDEANLSQTVYELRRALNDPARDSQWIESLPRRGYRFVGTVSETADDQSVKRPPAIAVLPFQSLSGRYEDSHLELGMADSLITSLARRSSDQLVVRSLAAVGSMGGRQPEALTIGRRLGVDLIVEGTIQHAGGCMRVNARLLDVASSAVLCAESLDAASGQLFALQDDLAARLAASLSVSLGPPLAANWRNEKVHALYLKARYCWHRWTLPAWHQAVSYLEEALLIDPDCARAHALLAACWSTLGIFGAVTPHEGFFKARRSAQRAIELDGDCADGHESMGAVHLFYDWDLVSAARALDRAIEIEPESANARHLRALSLSAGGHYDAALAEIQRALQANPAMLIANNDLGVIHYWGRNHQQAVDCLRATIEIEPGFHHAHLNLAFALLELGRFDEAIEAVETAMGLVGRKPEESGELALMLGRAGHLQACREIVERLKRMAEHGLADPFQMIWAHLGLGDQAAVIGWVEKAIAARSRDVLTLGVSPLFDDLRSEHVLPDILRSSMAPS